MENQRLDVGVNLLKQCKAEGRTYYEASQLLRQKGYSQLEIEQASYQFPYSGTDSEGSSVPSSPARPDVDNGKSTEQVKLQVAKEQLSQDYWYQYIPIVGGFYKAKRIGDYAKYQSLRTGRRQSTVMGIWLTAMIVGAFVALVIAPRLVRLVTKNEGLVYLSHYLGVLVAVVLLFLMLRPKRS